MATKKKDENVTPPEVTEAAVAKTPDAVETTAADTLAAEQPMIYAGVSLPGVPEGTVFTGPTPKVLDEPFVKELVIPLEKYPDFLKKKGVTTSREAFCYRKSAEYLKRLREEAEKSNKKN